MPTMQQSVWDSWGEGETDRKGDRQGERQTEGEYIEGDRLGKEEVSMKDRRKGC